jgi:hypothetical protein
MKTQNIAKRDYTAPVIEQIQLDNEISLALESAPPAGPGEPGYLGKSPEFFNNDPFKINIG